ncbi:MAG: ABC transporter ATP-binding protein [Anaerolineae bacterium]
MTDVAVQVEALSKMYHIGKAQQRHDSLREALAAGMKAPLQKFRGTTDSSDAEADDTIWALKDVSFEVKHGEVVGIIGRNGAGKSTLLKILSRITEPTRGRAVLNGRVGSLLEVGTGFHPELTGRENIHLNGAILGMRRTEIARKFDEIVDFSGVEKFLDTPVKRYSSGMYVRLAFAVAAHLEPEILVVDEVLAVGDAAFQKKCLGKMGEVAKEGRTVLFVSHNMAAIHALCMKILWLEAGLPKCFDTTDIAVNDYLQSVSSTVYIPLKARDDREGNGQFRFIAFGAYGAEGKALSSGEEACFEITYMSDIVSRLRNVQVSLGINTNLGENLLYLSTDLVGAKLDNLPPHGRLLARIDRLPLVEGVYNVNLYATIDGVLADWVQNAARVDVEAGDYYGTGRLTPSTHSKLLVAHFWEAEVC